jgi:hypothetical protein
MPADRSDAAVRAALRRERALRHDRARSTATCATLGVLAVLGPFVAGPLTGDPGATVGAIALSLLCVALIVALAPDALSAAEREHRELEAIWREVRTDADHHVPWDRYAAWVRSTDDGIDLLLLHCAPAALRHARSSCGACDT